MAQEMEKNPVSCPSDADLRCWLDHSHSNDNTSEIYLHINYCHPCQARLEFWSSFPELEFPKVEIDETGLNVEKILEGVSREKDLQPGKREVPLQPGSKIKSYILESVLGKGGMGVVFLARDEKLGRHVAIKILASFPELDRSAKVISEAKKLANIQHENVVRVLEVIEPEGNSPAAMVMELVRGIPFSTLIRKKPLIPPQRAAKIILETAKGVAAIHSAGLLHCDIKPENILLEETTGTPKLVDFGLARFIDSSRQQSLASPGGTPHYMSPEQVMGEDKLLPATDVYSLGVALYESITGELPYRGTITCVLKQISEEEPQPPGKMRNGLPLDLETICLKAMEKKPAARYTSARAMANDLENFLERRPISARPLNRLQKAWRWAVRNPKLAFATFFAVIGLLGLTAVSFLAAHYEHKGRLETQEQQKRAEANLRVVLGNIQQNLGALQDELISRPGTVALRGKLFEQAENDLALLARSNPNPELFLLGCSLNLKMVDLLTQIGNSKKAKLLLESTHADLLSHTGSSIFARDRLLGLAEFKLGDFDLQSTNLDSALGHYEKGLGLFRALELRLGPETALMDGIILGVQKIGSVYLRRTQFEKALEFFKQALELLNNQGGGNAAHLADLQSVHSRLAETLSRMGDPEKALEHARLAVTFAEKLVKNDPDNLRWKFGLIQAKDQLGLALIRGDFYADAEKGLHDNITAINNLVVLDPTRLDFQKQLALSFTSLADLELSRNQGPKALPHTLEAMRILHSLLEKDANNSQIRFDILKQISRKIELEIEEQNPAGAEKSIKAMFEIFDPMESTMPKPVFTRLRKQLESDQLLISKLIEIQEGKNVDAAVLPRPVANQLEMHQAIRFAKKKDFSHAMGLLESLEGRLSEEADLSLAIAKTWSILAVPENPKAVECGSKALVKIAAFMKKNPEFTANLHFNPYFFHLKKLPGWKTLGRSNELSDQK